MSFQRLAVADGTFLLRDSMLHPLFEIQVKKMRDIRSPRFSGAGIPPTKIPTNARLLLIFLALCHTVRVEQDPYSQDSSINSLLGPMKKRGRLKYRMKAGLLRMRLGKITPPSKDWTFRRRESAVLSAQNAVIAANRGSAIASGEDYDYQVKKKERFMQIMQFYQTCNCNRHHLVLYHTFTLV